MPFEWLWKKRTPYVRVGLAARVRAQDRLNKTPALATSDVARLVLENELRVVDRVVAANEALETKANGIAVLDLALIGVLATVALEHRASNPWIAIVAFLGFLASLFYAWRVNRVESHSLPGPAIYNLPTVANVPDNAAKIAQELTESWDRYATDERNVGIEKSSRLRYAFFGMYAGIVAFTAVAVVGVLSGPPPPADCPSGKKVVYSLR